MLDRAEALRAKRQTTLARLAERFPREGIDYVDLTEDEKEEWDAKEWDDDGQVPLRVESAAVNKWLFNADSVDKVLEHLMTRGQMVAGGDRLGKTIVFAANQKHADFIVERVDKNYPHLKGEFARVTTYAQTLIDAFSQKERWRRRGRWGKARGRAVGASRPAASPLMVEAPRAGRSEGDTYSRRIGHECLSAQL